MYCPFGPYNRDTRNNNDFLSNHRRIVGVAHVEDFESISDAGKRADCERQALGVAKMLLKERRNLKDIAEVVSAIQEFHS